MPEVITSLPVARPAFNVTFTATPQAGIVSFGSYTWGEKHLKDPDGNEVIPTVVTVPAMHFHPIGVSLTFTATVKTPWVTNIIEFYWDFGDGIQISTTSPTITHTYINPALGTITHLRARDDQGVTAWSSMNMMLIDPAIYYDILSSDYQNLIDGGTYMNVLDS